MSLVYLSYILLVLCSFSVVQSIRKVSQQDSSSGKKDSKNSSQSSGSSQSSVHPAPAPPPKISGTQANSSNISNSNYIPNNSSTSSVRSVVQSLQDQRRPSSGPPAPPIVVVSHDQPLDGISKLGSTASLQDKLSAGLDPTNGTMQRNPALGRLRPGPKDTIPMVGKPPRKQRSSRFVITDKVEIECLPLFDGSCCSTIVLASYSH